MTTPRNVDLLIKAYLAEGPAELPDRSFEAVRDATERTRQRRSVGLPRLPAMSDSARLLVAATLLLVVFVGFNVIGPLSQQPPTAPTPTPTPTATPGPLPSPSPSAEPGTFRVTSDFPVQATLMLPDRWSDCSAGPLEQGICAADGLGGVGFMIIDNVVAEPCVDVGLDPPVGPTVDDLAAAIAALPGFTSTPAIDVTVDGHPGKELTVTAPDDVACALLTWMGPTRTNGVGAAEINRIRIVDVDGVRILIAAAYWKDPTLFHEVLESARFP
jgi:hypothetical protein